MLSKPTWLRGKTVLWGAPATLAEAMANKSTQEESNVEESECHGNSDEDNPKRRANKGEADQDEDDQAGSSSLNPQDHWVRQF
jgi:hypothetical protein